MTPEASALPARPPGPLDRLGLSIGRPWPAFLGWSHPAVAAPGPTAPRPSSPIVVPGDPGDAVTSALMSPTPAL